MQHLAQQDYDPNCNHDVYNNNDFKSLDFSGWASETSKQPLKHMSHHLKAMITH